MQHSDHDPSPIHKNHNGIFFLLSMKDESIHIFHMFYSCMLQILDARDSDGRFFVGFHQESLLKFIMTPCEHITCSFISNDPSFSIYHIFGTKVGNEDGGEMIQQKANEGVMHI